MNQRKRIFGLAFVAASLLLLALSFSLTPAQAGENLDAPDGVLEEIYDLFWDPRLFSGAVGFPSEIEWFHNPTGMPGNVDQTVFENTVEASFNSWEAVASGIPGDPLVPRVALGGVDPTAPQSATLDGINAVVWVPGSVGGVLATTPCYKLSAAATTVDDGNGNTVFDFSAGGGPIVPFPGPVEVTYPRGTMLDCGIEFDSADPWTTTGTSGFDIQSVATHEIGHFLGLSHSTVGNLQGPSPVTATMAPFGTTANTDFRSLQEDDEASLLRTYARNAVLSTPQTVGGRGVIEFSLRQGAGCAPATGVSVWAYRTSEGLTGPTRIETFSGSEFRQGLGDEPYNGSVTLNVSPLPVGESYTIFARTFENDNTGSAGAFSAYRYNFTTINSNTLAPVGGSQTFDNLAVVGPIATGETVDLGTIGIQGCWNSVPGSQFDLTGDSATAPAEAVLGGQIAVTSSLSNVGSATTGSFEAGIYFSADNNINAADIFTGFTCSYPGGLAAGASASCDGTANVPSLVPGNYYVGLLVDRTNDVGESDESNNGVASLTTIEVVSNPLDPLVNGSFETGDLSGWTVKELNQTASNPYLKLTVDGAGVAYPAETFTAWPYVLDYFNSEPTDGQWAALHDWNGDDTTTSSIPDVNLRELYQDATLPAEATTLTFDYRAAWELFRFGNTLPRTFSVRIEPAGGGSALIEEVVLVAELGIEEDTDNPSGPPGQSYPPGIVDISSVAGQDVRIKFVWDVPEPGTGFAFFQLDNIRVNTLPNEAPVVSITSPGDGTNFTISDSIDFVASANDAEDGDVSASIAWSSDVDGAIGTGAAISYAGLSAGSHIIAATATDSLGRTGSSTVALTIEAPNTAPVVSISSPSDGAPFTAGDSILFAATATDDPDGDISANLSWSSDLEGVVGSGASFSTNSLGIGTHLITASVTDAGDLQGSDSISITVQTAPPVSDIVNPATSDLSTARGTIASGSYADTAALDGSVEILREAQVGGNPSKARSVLDHTWTLPVAPGNSYRFQVFGSRTSNAEGDDFAFYYSRDNVAFTRMTSATVGSATATAYSYDFTEDVAGALYIRVEDTDSGRGNSQLDELTIDWMAVISFAGPGGNTAPSVSITTPVNGTSATEGTLVAFAGTATDSPDGDLSASLAWTSSLDGLIGSGAGFPATSLSVGTHTIVASVTDSGGLMGSAAITVIITSTGGGTPISLSASGYKVKGVQTVDLDWDWSGSGSVDVYRDSALIQSGAGGSSYTDNIGTKGGGQTYVYRVCEAGGATNCSNTASVSF